MLWDVVFNLWFHYFAHTVESWKQATQGCHDLAPAAYPHIPHAQGPRSGNPQHHFHRQHASLHPAAWPVPSCPLDVTTSYWSFSSWLRRDFLQEAFSGHCPLLSHEARGRYMWSVCGLLVPEHSWYWAFVANFTYLYLRYRGPREGGQRLGLLLPTSHPLPPLHPTLPLTLHWYSINGYPVTIS